MIIRILSAKESHGFLTVVAEEKRRFALRRSRRLPFQDEYMLCADGFWHHIASWSFAGLVKNEQLNSMYLRYQWEKANGR